MVDIYEEIVRLRQQGRKGALATIINVRGSIPSFETAKMLVRDDGSIAGTIGGGCVEAEVWQAAREIMQAEKLAERSADVGAYLLDGLRSLMRHKVVGEVRGKGLLLGVELVKDRDTKEPLGAEQLAGIIDYCRENGVLVGRGGGGRHFGTTITLSPPLVITRPECDRS